MNSLLYGCYKLVDVWNTDFDQKSVKEYWVSNGFLGEIEANKRIREVLLLIFCNEVVVGVITAAPFQRDSKSYLYGRISIAKPHRGTQLFSVAWKFILHNLSARKNNGQLEQSGLVVELSNPKLATLAVRKRILQPLKAIPMGVSKNNMQVWLYEF
ncbi:hypothetical protein [Pseudoalteromonas sp. GB56]